MSFVRRVLCAGLVPVSLLSAPTAALASCPVGTFGQIRADVCQLLDCLPSGLPKEVKEIKRGIVTEYTGLFINDGFSRWVALDLLQFEISIIERYAGKNFVDASKKLRGMNHTARHFGRELKFERTGAVEFVSKKSIDASKLGALICDANAVWVEGAFSKQPPTASMSDSHNKLYLIEHGAVKEFGGPGDLTGVPKKVRDQLSVL